MKKTVLTRYGKVEGVVEGDTLVFKGIPYARPPVGSRRWRAPEPPDAWSGIYRADHYPNRSLQPGWDPEETFYRNEFYEDPLFWVQDKEDSLYLNIWVPTEKKENMPVAFFIHGGAFDHGTGHEVEFRSHAYAKEGIVLVSFNYRLGLTGFLASRELWEEDKKACGNYGILDQILALKWVKENIGAFGGDPGNITIFGQSAGGVAVRTLLLSEEAKGLYSKAIIQSAGGYPSLLGKGHSLETAEAITEYAMKMAGTDTFEAFRGISEEKLREVQELTGAEIYKKKKKILPFEPCINGQLLKADLDTLYEKGSVDVPVMIGVTADDLLVTEKEKEKGNSRMKQSCINFGICQSERKAPDVYVYDFCRKLPGDSAGAFHSSELWYMFGTWTEGWRPFTEADKKLSEQMVKYWTNFMKNGDPNGTDLDRWEPCSAGNPFVMQLTTETEKTANNLFHSHK